MSMQLERKHVDHWRQELCSLASSTREPKSFNIAPNGRCVVQIRGDTAYEGDDIDKAIAVYNETAQ